MKNILIFIEISVLFTCFQIFIGDVLTEDSAQSVYKSRIVGGELAKAIDYPYHVLVSGKNNDCGGTIIGPIWIITAAHCISHPIDMMWIVVGTESVELASEENDYQVEKVFTHPDFQISSASAAYHFDCAILKLRKELVFRPTVKAIQIGKNEDIVEGKYGNVTGFGLSEFPEEDGDLLRVLQLPMMLYDVCVAKYRVNSLKNASEFCVGGGDEGNTPCVGDSGGGFVADNKLLGVFVSGQHDCGPNQRRISHPGVFFAVPFAKQWICDVTGILD